MCGRTVYAAFVAFLLLLTANGVLGDGVWEGQIADENDDVEQQTSGMYMDSSDLEMIDDGNTHVGLRFLNVAVPAGSAISKAYIEFQVDEIETDAVANLIIYGDLSPGGPAFDSGDATNVSDRPATIAQIAWSPEHWATTGEKKQTADISAVIEEIVNQPAWRSGNALVLIIYDDPDNPATGFRTAVGGPGDDAALLHIEYGPAVKAKQPAPGPGQTDVPRETALSWLPGAFAASHDVYFGTVWEDVDAASRANPLGVLVSQGQTAPTYDPDGLLEFATTYYWRIDEVNGAPDNTVFTGEGWSLTTEPFAYAVQNIIATASSSDGTAGPENTVNGSGLDENDQHSIETNDMWLTAADAAQPVWIQYEFDRVYKMYQLLVWNYNVQFEPILGFGAKDVTVEYSSNGEEWTALGTAEFAKATALEDYAANTTVDMAGVPAKYVRLTINDNWGMLPQIGLSEVRFLYIPAHAREPQPAAGAAEVTVDSDLRWRAGRDAASHEVYFGTSQENLALAGSPAEAAFAPSELEFGMTYYWRVDEVADDGVWPGQVWSFATQEYALIDGFETYTDDIEAGEAIFDTWVDGWVNNTGSTVGYLNSPFAEKTIVHGGSQSMPLQYDNSVSPFYSETEREFETAQTWARNGAARLVLYVPGKAPAFVESADGSIIMNAIGTDIWNNDDQFRYAYKSLSGDGSMTVRVDSLVRSNEWAKAGVMIRETLEADSTHAFMCVTPGHGTTFQRRPAAGQASASTDVGGSPAPRWVRLTRTGNVFTASDSMDGVTWTEAVVSPALEIPMAANVYIGLALTSHDGAISTGAEFSSLSTTGNVTGSWQIAEIGAAQPGGNATEPMYVTITDAAGKTQTVVSTDTALTARPVWQEWAIPYSDLSGVDLRRVEKIVIGVGDRSNPAAGGTGWIYVDDVGFGRPAQ